eukprot:Rhum_TRINITY_DN12985_c0_g1::Rhum_TRINITY_DN12985_c0_g1_i1::g.55839::m.55839
MSKVPVPLTRYSQPRVVFDSSGTNTEDRTHVKGHILLPGDGGESLPAGLSGKDTAAFLRRTYVEPYLHGQKKSEGGLRGLTKRQQQLLGYRCDLDMRRLEQKGCSITGDVFEAMCFLLAFCGLRRRMDAAFEDMKARGIVPTQRCFDHALTLYAQSGDMEAWQAARRRMKHAGHPPTPATYTSSLRAVNKSSDPDCEAKMKKVLRGLDAADVRPTLAMARAAMACCSTYAAAHKVLGWFQSRGVRPSRGEELALSISLINACCHTGDVSRAQRVHDELRADGHNCTQSWNALLSVCVNNLEEAFSVATRMGTAGVLPGGATHSLLISAVWREILRTLLQADGRDGTVGKGGEGEGVPAAKVRKLAKLAETLTEQAFLGGHAKDRSVYDELSTVYLLAGDGEALVALETAHKAALPMFSRRFRENVKLHATEAPLSEIVRFYDTREQTIQPLLKQVQEWKKASAADAKRATPREPPAPAPPLPPELKRLTGLSQPPEGILDAAPSVWDDYEPDEAARVGLTKSFLDTHKTPAPAPASRRNTWRAAPSSRVESAEDLDAMLLRVQTGAAEPAVPQRVVGRRILSEVLAEHIVPAHDVFDKEWAQQRVERARVDGQQGPRRSLATAFQGKVPILPPAEVRGKSRQAGRPVGVAQTRRVLLKMAGDALRRR